MGRTRLSVLAAVAVGTLLVSWLLLNLLDNRGNHLSPVPWVVGPILLALGGTVLWAAWAVRSYLRGKRPALNALRAARTAALAKAAAMTGALLAGWYGGQVLLTLANLQIEAQQARAWSAGFATVCAIVLSVMGLIGEKFCQLPPPSDGDQVGIGKDGVHD